jgi:hypothetical protein
VLSELAVVVCPIEEAAWKHQGKYPMKVINHREGDLFSTISVITQLLF